MFSALATKLPKKGTWSEWIISKVNKSISLLFKSKKSIFSSAETSDSATSSTSTECLCFKSGKEERQMVAEVGLGWNSKPCCAVRQPESFASQGKRQHYLQSNHIRLAWGFFLTLKEPLALVMSLLVVSDSRQPIQLHRRAYSQVEILSGAG